MNSKKTFNETKTTKDFSLCFAFYSESEEFIIHKLRTEKYDMTTCRTHNNNTFLMCACELNLKQVALELLKTPYECELHKKNIKNKTALMIACDHNLIEIISKIIYCYEPNSLHDDEIKYVFPYTRNNNLNDEMNRVFDLASRDQAYNIINIYLNDPIHKLMFSLSNLPENISEPLNRLKRTINDIQNNTSNKKCCYEK